MIVRCPLARERQTIFACPRGRGSRRTSEAPIDVVGATVLVVLVFQSPRVVQAPKCSAANGWTNSSSPGWDGNRWTRREDLEGRRGESSLVVVGRPRPTSARIYPISLEWGIGPNDAAAADIAWTCLHASKSACSPAFHHEEPGGAPFGGPQDRQDRARRPPLGPP